MGGSAQEAMEELSSGSVFGLGLGGVSAGAVWGRVSPSAGGGEAAGLRTLGTAAGSPRERTHERSVFTPSGGQGRPPEKGGQWVVQLRQAGWRGRPLGSSASPAHATWKWPSRPRGANRGSDASATAPQVHTLENCSPGPAGAAAGPLGPAGEGQGPAQVFPRPADQAAWASRVGEACRRLPAAPAGRAPGGQGARGRERGRETRRPDPDGPCPGPERGWLSGAREAGPAALRVGDTESRRVDQEAQPTAGSHSAAPKAHVPHSPTRAGLGGPSAPPGAPPLWRCGCRGGAGRP